MFCLFSAFKVAKTMKLIASFVFRVSHLLSTPLAHISTVIFCCVYAFENKKSLVLAALSASIGDIDNFVVVRIRNFLACMCRF